MFRVSAIRGFLRPAVIVCLAAGVGGVHSVVAQDTRPTNPFGSDPSAVAAGERIFNSTCIVCHGSGGTGGRGPALNQPHLAHGGDDYELFKTIQNGIPGSGMPSFKGLPEKDIWRAVSYVRSLSGASRASPESASPPTGSATRGEKLFFGKAGCSSCHEVNGRGSYAAADLSAVGAEGLQAIRKGLLHSDAVSDPEFDPEHPSVNTRYVEAVLQNGQKISGLVRNEDSFSILVMQAKGEPKLLQRRSLRSLTTAATPIAPIGIEKRLSAGEIDDLVAYLWQQKARDVHGSIPPVDPSILSAERLVHSSSEPQNWLTYWGDYGGHHFSELRQIRAGNVDTLQARWAAQLPGNSPLEAHPIVVDGVMYVSGPPGDVYALDARTGLQIWKFRRTQDVTDSYQTVFANRGVAVLGGRVFVGTLDNLVIAIDARTGRELWERRIADTREGYAITGAPLALPGKVIVGISGGEYPTRGFLDAYDPATGKRLWRFQTIPAPGEPGIETWSGDSWKRGGGGTWLTGSYDADLNLLYWTVGNPAPGFNPYVRKGDNLYTDSVLALDPDTGKLKWYHQFTPNDSHDWDSTEDVVLAELVVNGRTRKVLLHADRNGFFYVLDRTTGQFLGAHAYVHQTWNDGFDSRGRPITRPASIASPSAPKVFPAYGGTNFQAPSFDERTGIFYVAFQDAPLAVNSAPAACEKGRLYLGGARLDTPSPLANQGIKAIDAASGRELWRFPLILNSLSAGVLGTRGGVLFAASAEGNLMALDMKTGRPLWHFTTGGPISSSPISYAVGNQQFVAVAAGNTVYSFALPDRD